MSNTKYGQEQVNKMALVENWEIWDAPKYQEIIYQSFGEFTCRCPRSGYPDFAKVHLIIVPDKKVLELKCLKLWLNSFRDRGISHENATQEIAQTLFETLSLSYIFVIMEYTPRGNLITFPMMERIKDGFTEFEEIRFIKSSLLKKIIK